MSPEAKNVIGDVFKQLERVSGVDEKTIQRLTGELQTALDKKDYETVARIGTQLASSQSLFNDLNGLRTAFGTVLERYGLSSVDIQIPQGENRATVEPSPATLTMPETTASLKRIVEKKDGRRDESKYVDNAPAKIALELIARDTKGDFVHKNVSTVSLNILKTDRKTEKDINDAHHRYETTTSQLGVSFSKIAKETKSKTISELITQILDKKVAKKVNDPEWIKFYENCRSEFGKMSPHDFIENVLQRFYSKEEKNVAKAKQNEAEKERKSRRTVSEISPSKIEPVFEILLCNRLLSGHVVPQLEQELLGGTKIVDLLKQKGVIKDSFKQELEASRETMGNKRKNIQITPQDFETTANFILDTLRHMERSLRGWHTIDKKLVGFRTLLALAQELHGTENMSTKIWTILYSAKQYRLDKEGFPEIALPGTN